VALGSDTICGIRVMVL